MLPEVKLKDFQIGSQFWVLKRKHARLVVGDKMIWAKFKQPCVRADSCYAEENYFSTLIHMWDLQDATSATLTHVDWRNHTSGHPRMYKANEVGPLLIIGVEKQQNQARLWWNQRQRFGCEATKGPILVCKKILSRVSPSVVENSRGSDSKGIRFDDDKWHYRKL